MLEFRFGILDLSRDARRSRSVLEWNRSVLFHDGGWLGIHLVTSVATGSLTGQKTPGNLRRRGLDSC